MSVQVVILTKKIYKRKPVERKTVDQTVSAKFSHDPTQDLVIKGCLCFGLCFWSVTMNFEVNGFYFIIFVYFGAPCPCVFSFSFFGFWILDFQQGESYNCVKVMENIRIKREESGWTGSDVNAILMMWVLYFSFPSRHTNQWQVSKQSWDLNLLLLFFVG